MFSKHNLKAGAVEEDRHPWVVVCQELGVAEIEVTRIHLGQDNFRANSVVTDSTNIILGEAATVTASVSETEHP